MATLTPEDDVVATYREHGQALARGLSARSVMAELYGKQEGCARGRGGSMHMFDAETHFYGGNAIVGGGLPLALGMGLANKLRGKRYVTSCFFGDGAAAEGEFYETLNLASLWQVPVLFVCENNQYAMGTALKYSHAQTNLAKKAEVHNIPTRVVDGMDVLAVEQVARELTDAIRAGDGPQFMECIAYRFRAHSMFDAELYREKAEVEEWKKRDPIELFTNHLRTLDLLNDDDLAELETQVIDEIDDAVAYSEAGTWEPIEDLTRFVYSERRTS
jgi:TPP-dependent pyruvate/acetoin dehydrogenase alpha subunit